MGDRKRKKRHKLSDTREAANKDFVTMQSLLKRFVLRAERVHTDHPDETQRLLQELRDTLYRIEPFKGDATWWPKTFDKQRFAIARAVQWVHRHHPAQTFAAVMICHHRFKLLNPTETAD